MQSTAPRCVSWNFTLQNWTTEGCTRTSSQGGVVTCSCNHLTNFAILVVSWKSVILCLAIQRLHWVLTTWLIGYLFKARLPSIKPSNTYLCVLCWNVNFYHFIDSYYHHFPQFQVSQLSKLSDYHIISFLDDNTQEASSKGHIQVPRSVISINALHVGSVSTTYSFECWKCNRSLWRLCDSVCSCALLHSGICYVDGSWSSGHVPETGFCLHSNNNKVFGCSFISLLE